MNRTTSSLGDRDGARGDGCGALMSSGGFVDVARAPLPAWTRVLGARLRRRARAAASVSVCKSLPTRSRTSSWKRCRNGQPRSQAILPPPLRNARELEREHRIPSGGCVPGPDSVVRGMRSVKRWRRSVWRCPMGSGPTVISANAPGGKAVGESERIGLVGSTSQGREDADRLLADATHREREHACRRGVEPLDVVDRQEQRRIAGERPQGGNERTEEREPVGAPVGGPSRSPTRPRSPAAAARSSASATSAKAGSSRSETAPSGTGISASAHLATSTRIPSS